MTTDLFDQKDTLHLHGIHVWSETMQSMADENLIVLIAAYYKAYHQYMAVYRRGNPKRVVEVYAQQEALACILRSRQLNQTCRVDINDFLAGLQGVVLWSMYGRI